MKLVKFAIVSASLLGLSLPAWTQEASQDATNVDKNASFPGILGYLDPKTGAFKPMQQGIDLSAASFAILTGEIEYKITVTIKSAIATSSPIVCGGNAATADLGSGTSHSETASVTASRAGSTASCTVIIPYAWALASAGSDSVSLSYSVTAAGGAGGLASRASIHSLPPIKVPANNATTTETVAVTI